ncbi:hypothetical protein [Fenollaria sporofastidiosus]|uniref:hypothetical protein n=1 Tax=Fenollaria sporofastidiosus TaxID=2811778 RepID=UPI0035A5E379
MFKGWDPELTSATAIDKNIDVNAKFETDPNPIVGPVDPGVTPNPNPSGNWVVTFKADATKGTVAKENTFYVSKAANKTLADLAADAPKVTKVGYIFKGWDPELTSATAIDKT